MADPLSISASIAGLITLADIICGTTFRYVKAARGTHPEVSALFVEVSGLQGILAALKSVCSKFEQEQIQSSISKAHFEGCSATLETIRSKLERASPKSRTEPATRFSKGVESFKLGTKWPFQRQETLDLLEEVGRHKQSLTLALSVDTINQSLDSVHQQRALGDEMSSMNAFLRKQRVEQLERRLVKEMRQLMQVLEPVDPRIKHRATLKLRHEKTGLWVLNHASYLDFLSEKGSNLWMHGIPGAGKTVLVSIVIEHIQSVLEADDALAFFYCEHKDPATQKLENIMGSFIKQLTLQSEGAHDIVTDWLQLHGSVLDHSVGNLETIADLLQKVTVVFGTTYLVIDGLDECLEDRSDLISRLTEFLELTSPQTRLLVASRMEVDIEEELCRFNRLTIAASRHDLNLYVASEIETRARFRAARPTLKELILKRLVARADGMFQWVKCQLDFLEELTNERARQQALDSLPPTLTETYERILLRLNKGLPQNRAIVRRALKWIAYSKEPLPAETLAVAISMEVGDTSIDPTAVSDATEIRRCCSSLVRDGPNGTLQLSHFSVGEFLRSIDVEQLPALRPYRLQPASDELELGQTCLTYLMLNDFDCQLPQDLEDLSERLESYPLLRYSTLHWDSHLYAAKATSQNSSPDILLRFFDPRKTSSFLHWAFLRIWVIDGRQPDTIGPIQVLLRDTTTLHFACCLGLEGVVSHHIEQKLDLNKFSSALQTPLLCAVTGDRSFRRRDNLRLWNLTSSELWRKPSRIAIIRKLLDAGVKESHSSAASSSDPAHDPLYVAMSQVQDEDMSKMLLNAGFKLSRFTLERALKRAKLFDDQPNSDYSAKLKIFRHVQENNVESEATALYANLVASYADDNSFSWVQQKLTTPSKNLQHEEKLLHDAIVAAAEFGQLLFLETNLARATDVAAKAPDVINEALRKASANGHTSVVKVLMDHGADILRADDGGNMPIHHAIINSQVHAAQTLSDYHLEKDNTLPSTTTNQLSVIYCAAQVGCLELIMYFIDCFKSNKSLNKELSKPTKAGRTAMHGAVYGGNAEIVRFLHRNQVPIETADKDGITALELWLGLRLSNMPVLEALLECGADFDPLSSPNLSVLHLMAFADGADATRAFHLFSERPGFSDYATRRINDELPPDFDSSSTSATALHLALKSFVDGDFTDPAFVMLLLSQEGIDVEKQDKEKFTPLNYLLDWIYSADERLSDDASNNIEIVVLRFLEIGKGFEKPDEHSWLWYHFLAQISQAQLSLRLFNRIFEKHTEIGVVTKKGDTIFHLACRAPISLDLCWLLLKHLPMDELARQNDEGMTVIHCLCMSSKTAEEFALLSHLLSLEIDYELPTTYNEYPVHLAAPFIKDLEQCREIIKASTHRLSPTKSGWTPLGLACKNGNDGMIEALLDAGEKVDDIILHPDPDYAERMSPPVVIALCNGRLKTAKMLIEKGADVNAKENINSTSMIHYLCFKGHEKQLAEILAVAKFDCNVKSTLIHQGLPNGVSRDASILHFAARYGSVEIMDILLRQESCPDVNGRTEDGYAPIHLALVYYERSPDLVKILRLLLDNGAQVDATDGAGFTPLHYAANINSAKACGILLSYGADANAVGGPEYCVPLHLAASHGVPKVVEILLESDADLTIANRNGLTPELVLLKEGHNDVIDDSKNPILKLPSENGSEDGEDQTEIRQPHDPHHLAVPLNPNQVGARPSSPKPSLAPRLGNHGYGLRLAAFRGDLALCHRLIDLGADIEARAHQVPEYRRHHPSKCSCTPLLLAISNKHTSVAEILIEKGASLGARTCDYDAANPPGRSTVHIAAQNDCLEILEDIHDNLSRPEWLQLVNSSTTYQEDDDRRRRARASPLQVAADKQHTEAMEFLLQRGADVDFREAQFQSTALHYAVKTANLEPLRILLDHGANVSVIDDNGDSPLRVATRRGYLKHMELLVAHGADTHEKDQYGYSLLHEAARTNKHDAPHRAASRLGFFLRAGLDPNELTVYGKTPLHYAASESETNILLQNGADASICSKSWGSPLHALVSSQPRRVCETLVQSIHPSKRQYVLNFKSPQTHTPMYLASLAGKTDNVKMLVQYGADTHAYGGPLGTALQAAWKLRRWDLVDFLLSNGAPITHFQKDAFYYSGPFWVFGMETASQCAHGAWITEFDTNLPHRNSTDEAVVSVRAQRRQNGCYYGWALSHARMRPRCCLQNVDGAWNYPEETPW